ncbi:hypothetical protein [Amycolatopsis nalaikhensis]|uniref:SAV-6107-like HEPN domain-containing protein n=1 Tax=Amycolatopsis nalaikhensis TaxID=715472 RepID=A0ABY8XJJ0_9PSEU|nr:hypothetical protein [Amycolatopsis sp. 2-2]WIV55763.1 hypothetical protein QP939_44310 [Amycolatopsis sp. 2-2]
MTSVLTDGRENPHPVPGPRHRPVAPDALTELARLAALAELARRASPSLMHQAVLAGASPVKVAAAAKLDVAEAHVRWHAWADDSVGLEEYLRVHTAFADAVVVCHAAIEEELCP